MNAKQIFCSACVLLILLSLLASCSIEKRRYFKGYHVMRSHTPQAGRFKPHPDTFPDTVLKAVQPAQEAVPAARHTHHAAPARTPTHTRMQRTHTTPSAHRTATRTHTAQKAHWLKKRSQTTAAKKREPLTKRQLALIIGVSLLLMAVAAAIAAPPLAALFVAGNQALTAANVAAAFGQFATARVSWVLIFVLDVVTAAAMRRYYKKERPKLSGLTALLRLLYGAFLLAGIASLFSVTQTASAAAVYNGLFAFNTIWNAGLIIFGIHLIMLGLMFHNEGGKKWVNVLIKTLLIIAGIGYILTSGAALLFTGTGAVFASIQLILVVPMICGEVFYALWKLIKGGKANTQSESTPN
ncbi:MAG: DUF4386 domain-containing protein [Bacteroidetes bacterium]|nr:DUF4386 domain-containing protein [Bacteroidota bacterium]